jgi:hypothetical protein
VTARMFFVCSRKVNDGLVAMGRSLNSEDDQVDLSAIIRRAIEIGNQRGFITFDEINELVPSTVEPEIIEAFLGALSDQGIDVRDS